MKPSGNGIQGQPSTHHGATGETPVSLCGRALQVPVRGGIAPSSEEIEPFLLFMDGTPDFGTDHDHEYQNCRLNLRGSGRVVEQTELFTFKSHDQGLTYRVMQVIEIQYYGARLN